MSLSRRSLLIAASLAAAPSPAWARRLSPGGFSHGVASGDPTGQSVILWTRFVPGSGGDGQIGWELSESENFAGTTRRGTARAAAASDYCIKVEARGLEPGRTYFYRFLGGGGPSPTGVTRTAPARSDRLHFALFSCANYPFGYFHAYGHAAERADIDLVIHVGDYIYESPRNVYPSAAEAVPGRVIEPAGEIITYADYCARYATYHSDPDLLELRRLKPFCVVWDDHEITNDAWRDGAQNHQEPAEGSWADRIAAASKAYFDWMPIRRPQASAPQIYRSLDWGDFARILLLDTRYIGRDRQLDYRRELLPALAGGGDAAQTVAAFRRERLDIEQRTLLGAAQEAWFARTLAESKTRGQAWQVIAQQVVMGEQIAAPGLTRLLPPDLSAGSRQWFAAGEQVSALGLPWNVDSWSGYPAARRRFLEACAADSANALVLAGDSHNCWINNLQAPAGRRLAAIEFAGGSVTSPGFERSLSNAQPGERETMMRGANANLAWCDLTNRGYGAFKLTRASCEAEWIAFPSTRERERPTPTITKLVSQASTTSGPGAWAAA